MPLLEKPGYGVNSDYGSEIAGCMATISKNESQEEAARLVVFERLVSGTPVNAGHMKEGNLSYLAFWEVGNITPRGNGP